MPQSKTVTPSMSRKASASKSASTKSRSASSASASKSRSASASSSKSVQMQVQTQGARQLRTGRRRKGLFTQKEVREMKSYIKKSLKFIYATEERSKAFEQYLRKLTAAAKKRHPAIAKEVTQMMKQLGGGPDQQRVIFRRGNPERTAMTKSQIKKEYGGWYYYFDGIGWFIIALIISVLGAYIGGFIGGFIKSAAPSVIPTDFYPEGTDPPTPTDLLELIESFLNQFAKDIADRVFTDKMIQFYDTTPKLGAASRTRSTLSLSGWSERVKTFHELEEYEAEHVRGNLTEMKDVLTNFPQATGDTSVAGAVIGGIFSALVFLAFYSKVYTSRKTDAILDNMLATKWYEKGTAQKPMTRQELKKFLQEESKKQK